MQEIRGQCGVGSLTLGEVVLGLEKSPSFKLSRIHSYIEANPDRQQSHAGLEASLMQHLVLLALLNT